MKGVTGDETVAAQDNCEQQLSKFGHKVKSYHADNLRFNSDDFKESYTNAIQELSICGVGAHHQNVVAEEGVLKYFTTL